MPRAIFCFLVLSSVALTSSAQEPEAPDPYEWLIESYQYPADTLAGGFTSPERGALRAPPLPAEGASDQEIEDFIRKSSSIVSHYMEVKGLGLPKGSLVIYDAESLTLASRLPRIAQNSVSYVIGEYRQSIDKYIGVDQTIIEAPTEMLRGIIARAGQSHDHTLLLEELEKAIGEGKATLLNSSRIETRSGNRSKVTPTGGLAFAGDMWIDDQQRISYTSEEEQFGTVMEIDPVLGSDNETIDLNIRMIYHYAPVFRHPEVFTHKGETAISNSVTDTFDAVVTSQYAMKDGTSRMLGVWQPEAIPGDPKKGLSQVCFATVNVVENLPLINTRLADMLTKHGEKVMPVPTGKLEYKKMAEEIPEGMIVRRYTIPPTFLSAGGSGGAGASAADPFAAGPAYEPRFTVRVTAKDILQSAGISFPKGSSANYIRSSSTLVVRNHPEHIDLVEAYIMSIKYEADKSIGLTLHIVEGPGDVMRAAVRKTRKIAEHKEVWADLIKQDGVSILTTNWIEARSGNRAKVESGRIYHYPGGLDIDSKPKEPAEKDKPKEEKNAQPANADYYPYFESQRIGTSFEVDPVLGADNTTIDLNLNIAHDYASPTTTHPVKATPEAINLDGPTTKFHQAQVTTQTTLRDGMTRLISMWKPAGTPEYDNADIVQVAFIKADIIELMDVEKVQ